MTKENQFPDHYKMGQWGWALRRNFGVIQKALDAWVRNTISMFHYENGL